VRKLDVRTYLSEGRIVAVVARNTATGDRSSTVSFLAGEESSLNFEACDGFVPSGSGLCKGESCERGSEAEAHESLHYENNLRESEMK
jgi:hypothetical protein